MKHIYKTITRYKDVDKMGYVHNSVYQVYFEEARIDMVRKEGYPYSKIEEENIILPISEIYISYKAPLRYDDVILVQVFYEYVKNFSIKICYNIFKEDGTHVCSGYTIHAAINTLTNDFCEVPEKLKEIGYKYLDSFHNN
ncbi:MAG TPA: thioesterase family protein [Spirochaetota bacterium]|nr:thioesterase family protein [Spirochaetota bacterium]HOL57808.1 thioesterase family protein [Spirochaetota bacterium]HPP05419.1 thioesterase family protein [Spirochaetota bacterium]